jgi:RNA polymerase sigma factor (sigma-70 family)
MFAGQYDDPQRGQNVTRLDEPTSDWMALRFEEHRAHLRGVAYKMLGSLADADDAVQESWLRVSRTDAGDVENLRGWLTTITARVCLNMLRSRASRREEAIDAQTFDQILRGDSIDPDQEATLADAVGVALLVVLERLTPAARLAFVLHDMFDLPFDEIAPVIGRSPTAARQLASRARRRIQGGGTVADTDLQRRREVVEAFVAASRRGDFDALLALLDPDVVLRVDDASGERGETVAVHGAQALVNRARAFSRAAPFCRVVLIDGSPGVVIAPRGRLARALRFTIARGKIVQIEVIANVARLRSLDLALLSAPSAPAGSIAPLNK